MADEIGSVTQIHAIDSKREVMLQHLEQLDTDPEIIQLRALARSRQLLTGRKRVRYKDGPLIIDGGLAPGEVALTFDDGPDPVNTGAIMETLREFDALCNFFQIGVWAQKHPEISAMLSKAGHVVGSHCMEHVDLRTVSLPEAEELILQGMEAVATAAGSETRFFRYPYGRRTRALEALLARTSVASFQWNIDPRDWDFVDQYGSNPKSLFTGITSSIKATRRGIVVLHDVHASTAIVLADVLNYLKVHDYTLVQFVPA